MGRRRHTGNAGAGFTDLILILALFGVLSFGITVTDEAGHVQHYSIVPHGCSCARDAVGRR